MNPVRSFVNNNGAIIKRESLSEVRGILYNDRLLTG